MSDTLQAQVNELIIENDARPDFSLGQIQPVGNVTYCNHDIKTMKRIFQPEKITGRIDAETSSEISEMMLASFFGSSTFALDRSIHEPHNYRQRHRANSHRRRVGRPEIESQVVGVVTFHGCSVDRVIIDPQTGTTRFFIRGTFTTFREVSNE